MSFLSNLFSPAQAPPTYNFKGMGTADKGVTSGIANIDRDVAATGYHPASPVQAGQQVAGAVQQLPGYANAALTQAADPQRALFDRMMHDNQQRAMATGVQQGVSNTPYQAGLVNDANNKFSQDWYNQQLQRTALG